MLTRHLINWTRNTMDKYIVKLNARAYRDLEEIYEYIQNELLAPDSAKQQTNRIKLAIKNLSTFPQAHQKRNIGKFANQEYRQLLVDNYVVIFKIDETSKIVNIITIQYQRRNI